MDLVFHSYHPTSPRRSDHGVCLSLDFSKGTLSSNIHSLWDMILLCVVVDVFTSNKALKYIRLIVC